MKTHLFSLVAALMAVAPSFGTEVRDSLIAQVSIRSDGALIVDGARSDLRRLDLLIKSRKEFPGEIWLYRAATNEAQRMAIEVIELARAYSLIVQPLRRDPVKIFPVSGRRRSH